MNKEQIIKLIGEDYWRLFQIYMTDKHVYFRGNNLCYDPGDVAEFIKIHKL